MNFLIFSHSVAANYADSLVDAIENAGHIVELVDHIPSVTDILNAQNAGRRVIVLGSHDAISGVVTERVGGNATLWSRDDFINSLSS